MFYRENGQFKTTYASDQQIFGVAQDRWAIVALLAVAFLVMVAVLILRPRGLFQGTSGD
jgi:branched-subunit amino acid ABC-type transport system permease component